MPIRADSVFDRIRLSLDLRQLPIEQELRDCNLRFRKDARVGGDLMKRTAMPVTSELAARARRQTACQRVLEQRYAWRGESGIAQVRRRVAHGLAMAEPACKRNYWYKRFLAACRSGFIPGGRILAALGTTRPLCLINCFVHPLMPDSESSLSAENLAHTVERAIRQAGLTMRKGGGVGYDLSVLPPKNGLHGPYAACGYDPISVLLRLDQLGRRCSTHGSRQAAQMAVLRIDHPDIEAFIDARQHYQLPTFNLSVAISDEFMQAVRHDQSWQLASSLSNTAPSPISARLLWRRLLAAIWDTASPGLIFIDQVRRDNNLGDIELIDTCNPCAEQYLPNFGACDLGSIDLTRLVKDPFGHHASFDFDALVWLCRAGVRALDNVLDLTLWPLSQQATEARLKRRIGLGITGLADTLFMLGLRYDRKEGRIMAHRIVTQLRNAAYLGSVELARERGAFPLFDASSLLRPPHAASRLPSSIKAQILRYGLRNSHLLALAPTGSISVAAAGNVSSGIEPVFASRIYRRLRRSTTAINGFWLEDFSARLYRLSFKRPPTESEAWCEVASLSAMDHLRMVATLQPLIDGAISKTVNLAATQTVQSLERLLWNAWEGHIKGISVFRPDAASESVLSVARGCHGVEATSAGR